MGFKYKNVCYETNTQFLEAFSQDCGVVVGGTTTASYYSLCKVNGSTVEIHAFSYSNNAEINPTPLHTITPQSSSCDYSTSGTFSNADSTELSWLAVSVWVVAWGCRKMIEVLKK